jgi:hypothetical protein
MATCEVCGNDYDKAFRIQLSEESESRIFDCFECAIHALAPACAHCGCAILGHGVESDGTMYCCAHCAAASGVSDVQDRADTPSGHERSRPSVERRTVGISRQSGTVEARDQASLPERGHARK